MHSLTQAPIQYSPTYVRTHAHPDMHAHANTRALTLTYALTIIHAPTLTHALIIYWNTQKGNDIRSSTVAGSRQLYSSLEDKQLPSL